MKASKEDSKLFYKLVNKQRCTTTNATTELSYNDENFNTPSQIYDGFYKYFRDLAIPKIKISDNTRVRIFFFCRAKRELFFQNSTLGYVSKTLNQIIFFSSTKIRIFFSATLGIRIFF